MASIGRNNDITAGTEIKDGACVVIVPKDIKRSDPKQLIEKKAAFAHMNLRTPSRNNN
jgi:hypothetical protein